MDIASGVVSIVAFSFQALEAINWLQDFCEEFGEDHKEEFLNDLAATAATLTSVKLLCEQIKDSRPLGEHEYRIGALGIQVEDCANELQRWSGIAKRLKSPPQDASNTKRPVALMLRGLWATFNNQATKKSKSKLVERLHWHQRAIGTSLAIVGRKFDISNAARLVQVEEVTQAVHEKLCEEADRVISRLDSLSASISSVAASSRSTDERIQDVRTETSKNSVEIESIKLLLAEVLSAQTSWSSSSSLHSNGTSDSKPSHRSSERGLPRSSKLKTEELESHGPSKGTSIPDGSGSVGDPLCKSATDDGGSQGTSESGFEPEFKVLLKATRHLIEGLRNLYHPTLAEYICTTNALKAFEVHLQFLAQAASIPSQRHGKLRPTAKGRVQKQIRDTKLQLWQLRRLCIREGLADDLALVDQVLGIREDTVLEWSLIRDSLFTIKLDLPTFTVEDDSPASERSARMAEWMLGVNQACTLNKTLYARIFANTAVKHNIDFGHKPVSERAMLKHWFLDAELISAISVGSSVGHATIHSAASTIIANDTGDQFAADFDGDDESSNQESQALLRLVKAPKLDDHYLKDVYQICNEPPTNVPEKRRTAAVLALEAYKNEESLTVQDLKQRRTQLAVEKIAVSASNHSIERRHKLNEEERRGRRVEEERQRRLKEGERKRRLDEQALRGELDEAERKGIEQDCRIWDEWERQQARDEEEHQRRLDEEERQPGRDEEEKLEKELFNIDAAIRLVECAPSNSTALTEPSNPALLTEATYDLEYQESGFVIKRRQLAVPPISTPVHLAYTASRVS